MKPLLVRELSDPERHALQVGLRSSDGFTVRAVVEDDLAALKQDRGIRFHLRTSSELVGRNSGHFARTLISTPEVRPC